MWENSEMAAFEKGHKKAGGRKKGTSNKAAESIKNTLNALLTDDELEERWRYFWNHKDPMLCWKAFELYHHYRYGKPVQTVVGQEEAPPIKIDISAIPTFHKPVEK